MFHSDHFVPSLPTIEVVQKWVREEMEVLGLSWNPSSARLDPQKIMSRMIDGNAHAQIDGKYYFQILADGVSCYRHISVCNVGVKLFDQSPNFNSLTSMELL